MSALRSSALAVLIEPGRRLQWFGLVALAVVGAGVEALGALLIFFAMDRIVAGGGSTPLDRFFPATEGDESLLVVAVAIGVFFIVRALFTVARTWFEWRTIQLTTARTSDRLFRRYLAASYRTHLERSSAELIRNSISSVEEVSARFLSPIVQMTSEAIVIVFLAAILAVTAPLVTAVAAVVLGAAAFVLLRVVHARIRTGGRQSELATKRSLAVLQQSLQDLRGIKIFGREEFFARIFRGERRTHARARYEMATLSEVPRVGVETLVFLLVIGFLALSTVTAANDSLAILGLFAYAALRIMPGISRVISSLNRIRFSGAAVANVVGDLAGAEPEFPPRVSSGITLQWAELAFADVAFRYEGDGPDVLRDVDVTLRRGETVGVVGPTGSGKSTFVDLFLGLLEPHAGAITLDGARLVDVLDAWQDSIGFVSQQIYLLDDTIRRNVAFGIGDAEIDDDLVWEALRVAQLATFVEESGRGLDAPVGERGVAVSGGERQRIAIARALYCQPDILVFDEATSALDTTTEKELLAAIGRLPKPRTVVTVAHRLSTVRACDRILVFDAGRVVGVGTYDALLDRSALFKALVRAAT